MPGQNKDWNQQNSGSYGNQGSYDNQGGNNEQGGFQHRDGPPGYGRPIVCLIYFILLES